MLTEPRHGDRPSYPELKPLFERYFESREQELRNRLVHQYEHIADFHSRRYSSPSVPRDDVRQVALIGVVFAVERFDPYRGVAFPTFAARTVEGECKRYLRDRTWTVRPPRRQQETYLAVKRAQAELTQELRRPPTVSEIGERIGDTNDHVLEALEAGSARSVTDLDGLEALGGVPPAPADTSPFDGVDLRLTLDAVLRRLPERDQLIIRMRFVDRMTETAIARDVGVSQSYLSRHLRRLLRDLRRLLDEQVPS